jgi:A/G-specific adenine glycosylase
LLAWYDRHRRSLPWRALPGVRPDPYRVWLSEIMLQQTTVRSAGPYFEKFTARWPTLAALAAATREDVLAAWAGLGYYSRARNLHACADAVMNVHGGVFPAAAGQLRALPGIGPYTAAAIAAIAFDLPLMPVDGNIERVVARLFAVEDQLPAAKARIGELAQSLVPQARAGDVAQAAMDLGAAICTPRKPACALCPLREGCAAFARNDAETFPRKAAKKTGALKRGAAFVVLRDDGKVLLRTRPEKGLLGGMTEVPGTAWTADFTEGRAKREAPKFAGIGPRWRRVPGEVRHVFTHFPLALTVYVTHVPRGTRAPAGARWAGLAGLDTEALPTVMRKVMTAAGIGPAARK